MGKWIGLLFLASAAHAQIFDIGAPVAWLNVGQSAQLAPLVYFNGQPVTSGVTFQWASSDSTILAVDGQGNLTGVGLGTATIAVTSPQYAGNGTLEMQVTPSAIVVSPVNQKIFVGDSPFQFSATAYDYFNNPIPGVRFQWEYTGESGLPDTNIATIAPDGTLSAAGVGHLTIHAYIPYVQREGKPSRYEGLASVDIGIHPAFHQSRILTNDPRTALALRPSPGFFSANDLGQIVFSGSLDALASAAILYDGGFHPLATGGVPAPFPGGVVAGFFSAAINNTGQSVVAVKAGANRSDGGLVIGGAQQSGYVLLDGSTGGFDLSNPLLDLNSMRLTPGSFNDNGTVTFLASYHNQDSPFTRDGIFRMFPGLLPELVWSSDQALPGINASPSSPFFTLDNTSQTPGWGGPNGLGIDNNDNVYFMANTSTGRALFRWNGTGATPVKILAKGDALLKSTVKDIQDLTVLKNGDLALHVDINTGAQNIVLYSGGNYSAPSASILVQANPNLRVLAANTVNGADAVLFTGVPPAGGGTVTGLYKWQGSVVSLVLAQKDPITYIHAATIGAKGDISVAVRETGNDFVVLKADGSRLFAAGASLNLSTPLHLTHLVAGSRSAMPSFLLGDPASVFDLTAPDTYNPRILAGDRLSDGSGFSGSNDVFENASGTLFFLSTPGGLFQSSNGQTKLMLPLNTKAPDGAGLVLRKLWSVNNSGALLFEAGTTLASQVRRLYILDAKGGMTLVSSTGEASPLGTGPISGWDLGALDDSGRVMMLANNGLILFDGSKKSGTLLLGRDSLGGETAVFTANLKAAGGKFYARISLTLDFFHSAIAVYDGTWQVLTQSGVTLPNGEITGYLQNSDANAAGDVMFTAQIVPSGAFAVVIRRASDGMLQIVHENSDPTDSGDYIQRYGDANLRDDGTPYFLAFDVNDRALVFVGAR